MYLENCGPCDEVVGKICAPGGTIYENEFWLVNHNRGEYSIPGHLIIKLKRHCEHLSELSDEEAKSLGLVIQRTCLAVSRVIKPEKIHVASYGEGVKHVHFFVIPRTAEMPASNFGTFLFIQKHQILSRLHLKKPIKDVDRILVVEKIKQEFNKILHE